MMYETKDYFYLELLGTLENLEKRIRDSYKILEKYGHEVPIDYKEEKDNYE